MMDTRLNTKRIVIFVAFAFGIPWTAALVLYLTVGQDDLFKAQSLANTIAVWIPWLANVATRLVTREGRANLMLWPKFRRGWRFYLAAWLLPLLAVVVGGAIFYLLFPQSFDPNLGEWQKLLPGSLFAGVDPWAALLAQTLILMTSTAPITAVLSFGEEFGWRGYLLPKLVERFAGASAEEPAPAGSLGAAGARKAALLTGLVHGVWHWPLIGMACMALELTAGLTILTLLVYPVFTCSLSVLQSWVTLRSGSMWPAAVAHGTVNPTSGLTGYLLKGPAVPLVGPEVTGLLGGLGFTLLALVLLFSRRAFAGGKEAGAEKEPAVVGAQKYQPYA
jgi:membrane protease YdiL (CAAX protease family)